MKMLSTQEMMESSDDELHELYAEADLIIRNPATETEARARALSMKNSISTELNERYPGK